VCVPASAALFFKLATNALTWQISLAFGSVAFFLVEPTVPGEPVNCQHVIGNQAKQFGDKSARNYSISSSTTGAQMSHECDKVLIPAACCNLVDVRWNATRKCLTWTNAARCHVAALPCCYHVSW